MDFGQESGLVPPPSVYDQLTRQDGIRIGNRLGVKRAYALSKDLKANADISSIHLAETFTATGGCAALAVLVG